MITIDLKIGKDLNTVKIKDEILFTALLSKNSVLIKRLIRSIHPFYKISDAFFDIVNTCVDFTDEGISIYTGLIVRTGIDSYAVLYLEGTPLDEEHLIKAIDDYIRDIGDHTPKEINVDKFEISKKVFLNIINNM